MRAHRLACVAVSLLAGLLLAGGLIGAGYAAGPAPVPPAEPATGRKADENPSWAVSEMTTANCSELGD